MPLDTETISGKDLRRIKLVLGAGGVDGGDVSGANPVPATIADGADVTTGSTADAAWISGAGTVVALLKKIASGGGGGSGPVTIVDGGDVAQGSKADVAWVSGDGTVIALLKKIAGSGGSAVSVADGADVAEGATTDAAVTTDANGTLSAKLRGLVKILGDAWDSANHRLNVAIQNALPAGSNTIGKVDQGTGGASAWKVDGSAVTQPVSGSVGVPGIDVNLSTRALESGGNLATIAGKDFATQATLALVKAKTDNLDVLLSTRATEATLAGVATETTLSTLNAKVPASPAKEDGALQTLVNIEYARLREAIELRRLHAMQIGAFIPISEA